MPNHSTAGDNVLDNPLHYGALYHFNGSTGQLAVDHSAQLNRIEQKLDRLLELLDKDKGLWVAPGPDDIVGQYIKDGD